MDYEDFNKEYKKFEMWNDKADFINGIDELSFGDNVKVQFDWPKNNIQPTGFIPDDRVNSPSHYTSGRMEAIDIIEDAISTAPTPGKGLLQAQVLKYILRLWLKDSPVEDAKKAEWYLRRLIDSLE